MRRSNASAITASGVNPPGMYRATPNMSGTHATAVEAAGAHAASVKSSASASSTTRKGVVGNKAGADQNERCHSSEYVAKHGVLR
jgi:hypothetical protein